MELNKEQEQIKFYNALSSWYTGPWSTSPVGSIGCVIQWVYVFCGLRIAESIKFDMNGKIFYYGKEYLNIEGWCNITHLPKLKFYTGGYHSLRDIEDIEEKQEEFDSFYEMAIKNKIDFEDRENVLLFIKEFNNRITA